MIIQPFLSPSSNGIWFYISDQPQYHTQDLVVPGISSKAVVCAIEVKIDGHLEKARTLDIVFSGWNELPN